MCDQDLLLQWWCMYDPATQKKRGKPKNAELSGPGAAADAARFLEWYIKEGHKGYKVWQGAANRGGRKVMPSSSVCKWITAKPGSLRPCDADVQVLFVHSSLCTARATAHWRQQPAVQ